MTPTGLPAPAGLILLGRSLQAMGTGGLGQRGGRGEAGAGRGLFVPVDVEGLHYLLDLVGGQRLHGVAQGEHR